MRVFEAASGPSLRVYTIPAMFDNFMYGLCWDGGAAVIDPSEGELVLQWVRENNLDLKYILNTHHHGDHVFGNLEVKEAVSGVEIIGPDDSRIPGLDRSVGEGDTVELGPVSLDVWETPGHGDKDISFYLPPGDAFGLPAVFVGDTIFGAGCGRIMEGSGPALWTSLQRLAGLPDETLVFFGHEYTLDNLAFALSTEPENTAMIARMEMDKERRDGGLPTAPSSMKLEKETNPFLRAGSEAAFIELRAGKDKF